MADRKISDLAALTAPAAGDYLPIVDISEPSTADKNKRITIEELLRGAPDGTAAAPGIAFESDPNTGIYSPGADQVAISTGGTGRLFVDASGNVGVGTASAPRRLHVSNGYSAATSIDGSIALLVTNNAGANDFAGVGIIGGGTSGGSFIHFGDTANAGIGRIGYFHSDDSFRFNTNGAERLRITSAGLVGVGVSAPQQLLHVSTNSNATTTVGLFENASTGAGVYQQIQLKGGTHTLTLGLAGSGTSGSAYVGSDQAKDLTLYTSGAASLVFQTNNTERFRCDSSGRLLVGTSSNSGSALLQVNGDRIRVSTAKTPASATDTGITGEICWDANYIYVCTATNTWKRTAIATW